MNQLWDYQPSSQEQLDISRQIADDIGLHPIAARILVKRGIVDSVKAKEFLHPQLPNLHDPFLMKDMDKAVERLNHALRHRERVMIFGDYDADGVTAVAVVYRFLSQYTADIEYRVPDREQDGYGISKEIIDEAAERGVSLIITLDCGIKSIEETRYASERGIDFIICDHHVVDDELPPAVAILDAKRADNTYPYTELSGCGVGFKLMQAFAISNNIRFNRLVPLLDLVAISIIADLVPMTGENRILAYHGLKQLNYKPCVGIRALIEVADIKEKEITMGDIGYKLVPRINASGRVQSGKEAVDILVEKDFEKAREKAKRIEEYNDTRRDLDKSVTEEANKIVNSLTDLDKRNSIVIYNEAWHMGVIGIVTSRLVDLYYRPTVVLTRVGDFACGSVRSVSDFDVHKALEDCSDLLINFGGHPYAAGLTLSIDRIPAFTQRFEDYVAQHLHQGQRQSRLSIDAEIDFKDISIKLVHDVNKFAPFGNGNEEPIFYTQKVYDYGTSKIIGRYQEHLKLELVDSKSNRVMNGIAFGKGEQWTRIRTKRAFNICYRIKENTHRKGEAQIHIEAIRPNAEV